MLGVGSEGPIIRSSHNLYDDDIISRQLLEAGSLTTLQEPPPVSCMHKIMHMSKNDMQ